nr:MAG TPA: hypothetical protein [Caudoviricetes sp.]
MDSVWLADAATVTVVLPLPPESGVAVIKSFFIILKISYN